MYNKLPDDPWFDELNPFTRVWLYENWMKDIEEKEKFAYNYSVFLGAFSNPAMAEKLRETEKTTYRTDDEQFDKLFENIKELNRRQESDKKPRKRRLKALLNG